MHLKETYNKIAEEWHEDHLHDSWSMESMGALAALLPKSGSILNVGCGPGIEAQFFVEKGFKVHGFDISEKMVEIATHEVPSATFEVLGLEEVGSLTQNFDSILMRAVLLHVPKAEASLRILQISERLKRGGYFFIAVKEKYQDGPEEEVRVDDDYGYSYERFFSYFTRDEIVEYFENAGLEIVYEKNNKTGKTNWIQIIGRKL